MGNQCCCDEDASNHPVDPNVLVWRPEAPPGKRSVTSAELRKRDEQLDAALDRIARHQPDDPSPRQSVPKAAEVAEFRRSQLSQASQLTEAERCFQEARPHHQVIRPPERIGEDMDSNEGLLAPSDTSYPAGEVPQHEVQWIYKYDGDAAGPQLPQLARASPSNSPSSPAQPLQTGSSPSVAAEGHGAVTVTVTAPASPREERKAVTLEEPTPAGPAAKPALKTTAAKPAAEAEAPAAPAKAEEEDDIPLLPMRFQLPDKSFQDVYFFAFPIGFDLGKQTPLTVRGVKEGSYAEQLGVQPGWKICQIGTVEVGHLKPKEMLAVLSEQKKIYLG